MTPWPTVNEYAMHHRCAQCGALPGEGCTTPRGVPTRLHMRRQDAGVRHHRRDVAAAPWADERRPGRRYDSLPFAVEFTSLVLVGDPEEGT
jgi:hypothetical protein